MAVFVFDRAPTPWFWSVFPTPPWHPPRPPSLYPDFWGSDANSHPLNTLGRPTPKAPPRSLSSDLGGYEGELMKILSHIEEGPKDRNYSSGFGSLERISRFQRGRRATPNITAWVVLRCYGLRFIILISSIVDTLADAPLFSFEFSTAPLRDLEIPPLFFFFDFTQH